MNLLRKLRGPKPGSAEHQGIDETALRIAVSSCQSASGGRGDTCSDNLHRSFCSVDNARLDEMRKQVQAHDEHFTLLLIGPAGVGKTQLLANMFPEDEELHSKVSYGEAGVVGAHGFDRYFSPRTGITFLDSAGLETGGTADDYVARLDKLLSGDAQAAAGQGRRPVDCVWFCAQSTDCRMKVKGIEMVFDKLNAARVPVIYVYTKSDHLRALEMLAQVEGSGPPPNRQLALDLVRSWKEKYSCVKDCVFVETLKNPQGTVPASLAELVRCTTPFLEEGARITFIMAQVANLRSKIQLSCEVLVSGIRTFTAAATLNPIPFGEAALSVAHCAISGKVYKIWNLPDDCGGKVGQLVATKSTAGMSKWLVIKGTLSFFGAGWVSDLMDPGKAPRYFISAGLPLTAFLMRLHLATGGAYARLSDDEFKSKVSVVMKRYKAEWDHRAADFVTSVGLTDVLTDSRKEHLVERMVEFLSQLAAQLPAGHE